MTKEVKILDISHEELVNLFSGATYGNPYMGIEVAPSSYELSKMLTAKAKETHEIEDICQEDIWAMTIKNGGTLAFIDYEDDDYNEEEDNVGNEIEGNGVHFIDFEKLIDGLNKSYQQCPNDIERLEQEEDDMITDYNVCQVIMFGEVVYG